MRKFEPNEVLRGAEHGLAPGLVVILVSYKVGVMPVRIDEADYDKVKDYRWYVGPNDYVVTHTGRSRRTIYLGRLLTGAKKNERVRYEDGNAFNNRRSNLKKVVIVRKVR